MKLDNTIMEKIERRKEEKKEEKESEIEDTKQVRLYTESACCNTDLRLCNNCLGEMGSSILQIGLNLTGKNFMIPHECMLLIFLDPFCLEIDIFYFRYVYIIIKIIILFFTCFFKWVSFILFE